MNGFFRQSQFRRFFEWLNRQLLFLCALFSVVVTFSIISILAFESFLFFQEVSFLDFVTQTEWTPLFVDPQFGIWPLFCGTLLTSLVAMLIAAPFGILSAIYIVELAPKRMGQWIKPLLELLAGVPTVVYGYFALVIVTPMLQSFIPDLAGFNALSAGLVMGIMITPMVSSLTQDALLMVPKELKEAAYALGARPIPTIFKVIIPAATSGIGAALALGMGRALGETMIVTIAAGQRPYLTLDPRVPIETMTAFIMQVSLGDVAHSTLAYRTIFVVGSALFVFAFMVHALGLYFMRKKA